MLFSEIKNSKHHYILLILSESILCTFFLLERTEWGRFIFALAIGLAYFLWGIWAHKKETKTIKLVLEYALFSAFATTVLIILTKQ